MRPNDEGISFKETGILPEIDYDSLEFYECLSSGTYGTVYRAKWRTTGFIVAAKRLLVLEKEAHILSLLRHRNIIQFHGAVTKPPNFCIVTEFASNGSLYGYLHDKTKADLSFDAIVQWALDIASGVQYLHFEAPVVIVHRDLKSKNVVISSDNVCKLCDFGTSKALANTTRMSYVGTMPWMSPEMIQSKPVSESTDTWSYGVILWELITREIPFANLNEFRIGLMVVENGLRLTIPSSCPEPFADLLRRCWDSDPKSRPDFKEILKILNDIRHDDSTSTQTREFLGKRTEWKLEIQHEADRLKEKESELNDKQLKLREWEQRLRRREQNLEYHRRRELPSHDANVWSEEDVAAWLLKRNFNGVAYQQLVDLGTKFRKQQITGERLLLLTDADLTNLGVDTPAFKWQLLREITRLDYDNRRLINFPPLSNSNDSRESTPRHQELTVQSSSSSRASSSQIRSVDLTLLFTIYVRPCLGMDSHKWKVIMDIDDDHDFMTTHPTISKFEHLIVDVRFMVPTPPYIYTVTKYPYVMQEWLIGFSDVTRVQCVVNFADNVRQPRNTTYSFDVDYEKKGLLMEKHVQLHLKPSLSSPRILMNGITSVPNSISSTSGRSYLTTSTSSSSGFMHGSRSSPVLAPAWQDRSFPDAVPVVAPPPQAAQKSPLWSQIVANLVQDTPTSSTQMKKQTSVPTQSSDGTNQIRLKNPRNAGHQHLNTAPGRPSSGLPRTVSDPVTFTLATEDTRSKNDSAPVTPRRRGRIRYSRNYRWQPNTSDSIGESTSETAESSSNSSTLTATAQQPILDEASKLAPGPPSSAVSVQVYGGNQKWKWKHKAG